VGYFAFEKLAQVFAEKKTVTVHRRHRGNGGHGHSGLACVLCNDNGTKNNLSPTGQVQLVDVTR
jgi:hypothetical protein